MKGKRFVYSALISGIAFFSSCSLIEKGSMHGFESGYYYYHQAGDHPKKIYLDITDDTITGYEVSHDSAKAVRSMTFPLSDHEPLNPSHPLFVKKSLDIDLTSVLLKYRPPVHGLPAQLTTDFNAALYTGWRFDYYHLRKNMDPLKKWQHKISSRGFDVGVLFGGGSTLMSPFTTRDAIVHEYNGVILQFGLAGFIESDIASFGISCGYDYLLSPDRSSWIYHDQPWIGLVVGIALE